MAARFNPPPNWPAPPAGWTPTPGWTPDPAWGPAPEGWQLWIEDSAPAPDGEAPRPPAFSGQAAPAGLAPDGAALDGSRPQRPWFKKKRVIIPGALLLVIIFGSALNGAGAEDDDAPVAAASQVTQEPAKNDEKSAAEIAAEAEAEEAAKAEKERAAEEKRLADEAAAAAAAEAAAAEAAAEAARLGTLSQQNAYRQAKNYVETFAFSRAGLLDQLTSEYGGQFPVEDAEFGVARLEAEGGVDWLAEAVEAAQNYQETFAMSRQGLIDQLTSEYGSQFTVEQATHAVNTLGL